MLPRKLTKNLYVWLFIKLCERGESLCLWRKRGICTIIWDINDLYGLFTTLKKFSKVVSPQ